MGWGGVGWIGDVNVRVNVHNGWGGLITFLHVCYIYAVLRCCHGLQRSCTCATSTLCYMQRSCTWATTPETLQTSPQTRRGWRFEKKCQMARADTRPEPGCLMLVSFACACARCSILFACPLINTDILLQHSRLSVFSCL